MAADPDRTAASISVIEPAPVSAHPAPSLTELPGAAPAARKLRLPRTFDSFQDGTFRWFFLAIIGWFAATSMQMLVRGYIVYNLTGSYAALGLMSLASAIPGFFSSLLGGILADRTNKKRIVQIGLMVNFSVTMVLAALMLRGVLVFEYLLVSGVIQGIASSMMMPASRAMISEVVSPRRLMNAVALNLSAQNIMRMAAPGIGGVLLGLVGPGWVYIIMAVCYGSAVLMLMAVHRRTDIAEAQPAVAGDGATARGNGVLDGFRYIWRDRAIFFILLTNFLIVLVSMPFQQLLPGFAKDVLGAGPARLGLLMTLLGTGTVIGSLGIASTEPKNRGRLLILSGLLLGVALLSFCLSSWYWVSAVLMLAVGIGEAGRMSMSNVLLQSYSETRYMGRVMSIYLMQFSLVSLGTFLVAIMASLLGVRYALTGTSFALLCVASSLLFVGKIRRLQ